MKRYNKYTPQKSQPAGGSGAKRPRSPLRKVLEGPASGNGRFVDLLQELAVEHFRELDAQKLAYEKQANDEKTKRFSISSVMSRAAQARKSRSNTWAASDVATAASAASNHAASNHAPSTSVASSVRGPEPQGGEHKPSITIGLQSATPLRSRQVRTTAERESRHDIEPPPNGIPARSKQRNSSRARTVERESRHEIESQPNATTVRSKEIEPAVRSKIEPQPPTEPPPELWMPDENGDAPVMEPAFSEQSELELLPPERESTLGCRLHNSESAYLLCDLGAIVPAASSRSAIERTTMTTVASETCDLSSTTVRYSILVPGRVSDGDSEGLDEITKSIQNLQSIDAKWEEIVRQALTLASREFHLPRMLWKTGFKPKHAAKARLADQATQLMDRMYQSAIFDTQVAPQKSFAAIVANVSNQTGYKCEAIDPHAGPRLAWTLVGVMFMLYDLVYVPMQAFKYPSDRGTVFEIVDKIGQVYWTLDIGCCFLTAVYTKSVLEKRFAQIARCYARTWLIFDLIVTLPLWYIMIGTQDVSRLKTFVRILRFLRLVRLAKLDHVLKSFLEVINSTYVLLIIDILKIIVGLCMFLHLSSCIWFYIGTGTGGWVERWNIDGKSIGYQYLSSNHWALCQFQGTTEIVPGTMAERGYAVGFLLMSLFSSACFVSRLTTIMGQLQEYHNESTQQQRTVKNYLNANKISTHISIQVNRYLEWNHSQKRRQQQAAEVLLVLPTKLLMDIYDEVRGPVLAAHPFLCIFRQNFTRVLRRVCFEALEQVSPVPSELVYAEGDECFHMYFIMCGQLRYEPRPSAIGRVKKVKNLHEWEEEFDNEDDQVLDHVLDSSVFRPVRLGENEWLSEAVLWTEWSHRGELTGLEDCAILMLDADRFAGIVKTFESARSVASLYAKKFVVCLNRYGHTFTDLIPHADLFDYGDDDGC